VYSSAGASHKTAPVPISKARCKETPSQLEETAPLAQISHQALPRVNLFVGNSYDPKYISYTYWK